MLAVGLYWPIPAGQFQEAECDEDSYPCQAEVRASPFPAVDLAVLTVTLLDVEEDDEMVVALGCQQELVGHAPK